MKIIKNIPVWICPALLLVANISQSAVSEAEAHNLGKNLTPFGAEMAGNSEGTIPAWTGGLTAPPHSFNAESGQYVDPFSEEKPVLTITAANFKQYAEKISAGQKELFRKYPDSYQMQVFPSHRTHAAPQWIYDAIRKNAVTATISEDGNSVSGVNNGIAFPIPKSGSEVIWNHLTRWEGRAARAESFGSLVVESDGTVNATIGSASIRHPLYSADPDNNDLLQIVQVFKTPARKKGEALLVKDPMNQAASPRQAWQYIPGQRRVRRAPSVAHDTPQDNLGGYITFDDGFVFNGSPERFEWKLMGKKEMYIPYNNYKIFDGLSEDLTVNKDVYRANHLNPDYTRWELHRVWVVEASLKDDSRHIYQKRVFYIDEDSWHAAMSDSYDTRGNIWKTSVNHLFQEYRNPGISTRNMIVYDLNANVYVAENTDFKMREVLDSLPDNLFTPQYVRSMSTR